MRKRFLRFMVGLLLVYSLNAAAAPLPKIWFSMGAISSPAGHQSWDALFYQPDSAWPPFMDHVTAVGVLTQALVKISDADLAKVVARLKEKRVALGVEMLAQSYDPPGCGGGVEGYYPTDQVIALAAKLKRAGAEVAYIAMDEPLWFGHYYNGEHACHSSIDNVAERVAENLQKYLQAFPNAVVGDGEPFPSITDQPAWKEDYRHWIGAFHARTGKDLAFLDVDINWGQHSSWPGSLQAITRFARDVHLPLGIIYNAAPPTSAMNNQGWLDDAERNFTHIEGSLGIVPDWVVFTSWDRYPGHALSDQNGPGEDYLVKKYLKLHGVQ